MKTKLYLIFILLILYSVTNGQDFKRYQFKSGKVVYKLSGMMTGTETMYFDDYGRKEVRFNESEVNMMGTKQKTSTQTITDGKYIYSINKQNNTAQKMENPIYSMFTKDDDLQKIGDDIMKKLGGKKIGNETINGKDCEIWEVQKLGGKVWVWNSISIKSDINMMGMKMTQVAESVETNIDVSPDLFKLPKGITIQDMGSMNNMMGK
ncbi:hypothetical protein MNBD_IGNAVI01-771 [hydrothermal vent metagenome]|uniref:Uncharacterized protein n=1 Tax=hydrothermal vent metagenome TaxID=652676 RepID=A0A3B1DC65_9ZZZZ